MTIESNYIRINFIMSDYLDPNNEELLKDFFIEAQMQVESLEQNILALENDPGNSESVDEIFRAAHTLKGSSATVQMMEITDFTHVLEDVLDEIRSDNVAVTGDVVDTLLESIDIIKTMIEVRSSGSPYEEDVSPIVGRLKSFLPGKTEQAEPKTETKPTAVSSDGVSEYELLELREAAGENSRIFKIAVTFNEENPMNTVGGIQIFAALKNTGTILKTIPEFEQLYEDRFFPVVEYYVTTEEGEEVILENLNIPDVVLSTSITEIGEAGAEPERNLPEEEVTSKEEEQSVSEEKPQKKVEGKRTSKSSVLRVDSSRIDNLLNLVSEAVINKSTFNQIGTLFTETQIDFKSAKTAFKEQQKELFDSLPDYLERIHFGTPIKEIKKDITERFGNIFTIFDEVESEIKSNVAHFRSTSQNLERITGELHEKVLQIRMVAISQIFSRFPRLVRDVSKSLKKKVNLIIQGEATELDKSVIEDLLDPLIHCVRNSVDHGIEIPADRKAAGKPEEGNVLLKASNEGNIIIIEVSDDGKGIDVNSVREKAIERGIIHPNKNLSDIEAFNLIFEAGFSTAQSVTNISGRGVGLDVVKKKIEKLNGSVSVWSEPGKGTKITIKLPLTLAIIQGLLVRLGKEIYAIPITSVLESHRIKPTDIKLLDNYEVFNVREDVVSLIRLDRLFRISADEQGEYHFVVIVGSEDKKMGLMVDGLIGEEDVVIKPLKDRYTNAPGIAGATILGDGTVSLIIDVSQLLELGLKTELEKKRLREATIT